MRQTATAHASVNAPATLCSAFCYVRSPSAIALPPSAAEFKSTKNRGTGVPPCTCTALCYRPPCATDRHVLHTAQCYRPPPHMLDFSVVFQKELKKFSQQFFFLLRHYGARHSMEHRSSVDRVPVERIEHAARHSICSIECLSSESNTARQALEIDFECLSSESSTFDSLDRHSKSSARSFARHHCQALDVA